MALTRTLLVSDAVTSNTSSYNTATFNTPTTGALLATVFSGRNGTITIPTASGHSLTWQRVTAADSFVDTGDAARKRIAAFVALANGGTSLAAVTFSYGAESQTGAGWAVFSLAGDFSGAASALNIVRQANAAAFLTTGTTPTISFPVDSLVTNVSVVCTAVGLNAAITEQSLWDEHHDTGFPSPNSRWHVQSQLIVNSSGSCTLGSSTSGVMNFVEIQEVPTVGGGQPTVRRFGGSSHVTPRVIGPKGVQIF